MAECVASAAGRSSLGKRLVGRRRPWRRPSSRTSMPGRGCVSRSGWSASSSSNTICARLLRPLARRLHLHAGGGLALAGGGQHALALHLDHAGAAVAVGAIAGCRMPAQVRDLGAVPLRHLPDGLARLGLDLASVQREGDLVGHGALMIRRRFSSWGRMEGDCGSEVGLATPPGGEGSGRSGKARVPSCGLQLDLDEGELEVVGVDDVVMHAGLAEVGYAAASGRQSSPRPAATPASAGRRPWEPPHSPSGARARPFPPQAQSAIRHAHALVVDLHRGHGLR